MSPGLGTRGISDLNAAQFEMTTSYRFLNSANLFIGTEEQSQVKSSGNEPRHTKHSVDLSLRYNVSQRFSATFTVPFLHTTTSFTFGNGVRQSAGPGLMLGDIRLQGGFWVLDPLTHPNGNLAMSLGLKIPTGNEASTWTINTPAGPLTAPADLADLPGDGGWGIMFEGRWFQKAFKNITAYASGFYMFNPRNTNGVEPLASLFDPNNQFFMSVPDQYDASAGLTFPLLSKDRLSLSLGGRVLGVPITDVFGGSDGFRRPGYAVFFVPAVTWNWAKNAFNFSAPIAVKRSLQTSVLDKRRGVQTNGGLADFVIVTSYSRLF